MSRFRDALVMLFLVTGVAGGLTVSAAEPANTPVPKAQSAATQAPKQLFAIAADGKEPTAQIPYLAARATHYHIYDENGGLVEVLVNPFLKQEEGVGPAAAQMLSSNSGTPT